MKKLSKIILVVVAVVLVLAMGTPVAFAENGEQPTATVETPTVEPTVQPTTVPTVQPTTVPTVQPTVEPTTVPTSEPTPVPEDAGKVDLSIYVYNNDKPAEGYTVKIDETKLVADKEGKVEFKNVTVEQHNIKVIDPDGVESVGILYMSRGDVTVLTDKAMGGKYGMDIAKNANHIYMNIKFMPQQAMDITSVSESAPKPAATASNNGQVQDRKAVTATFRDSAGKAVKGMEVQVTPVGGTPMMGKTDSGGKYAANGLPYGTSRWSATVGGQTVSFDLEMRQGVQTSLASTSGDSYVINVSPSAANVYLEFKQSGDGFVLEKVAENATGGMSNMVLGIIIVAIIVVVVIVLIVVARYKKKNKHSDRSRGASARVQESQGRKQEAPVKKTGGANKFDDRSRM